MKQLIIVLTFVSSFTAFAQWPVGFNFGNQSTSYQEMIDFYTELDKKYDTAKLLTIGTTDVGKPLHAFIIDRDQSFFPSNLTQRKKPVILINNGIHPGEPCGIDASMMLAEQMLTGFIAIPNVQILIIPALNVGGMLNRSCCSRANQNGPELYGFRGNAKNLDLNRDFVKTDSENVSWLIQFMAEWNPDVFIDTHTSNGADYQYVMTLIQAQHNKLHPEIDELQDKALTPFLFNYMAQRSYELTPYVHTLKRTPDHGIFDFNDTPRFSTGHTALRNTLSFVSEAHMWKPFEERVKSTYLLLYGLCNWMEGNSTKLISTRQLAEAQTKKIKEVPVAWELDTTKVDSILFKGYEAEYIPSNLSKTNRLSYNREKPYTKNILFYHNYKPTLIEKLPKYYVIPQAWKTIANKLEQAGVDVFQLNRQQELKIKQYHITDFETSKQPYEGHYVHSNVSTEESINTMVFNSGDFVVPTNQALNTLIANYLSPRSVDGYFAWGFLDAILQQKEWFSDYVFEEKATEILNQNPGLQAAFNKKMKKDESFAKNHWAQLYFVYKASAYYEETAFRYPVFYYNGNLSPIVLKRL